MGTPHRWPSHTPSLHPQPQLPGPVLLLRGAGRVSRAQFWGSKVWVLRVLCDLAKQVSENTPLFAFTHMHTPHGCSTCGQVQAGASGPAPGRVGVASSPGGPEVLV